MSVLNAVAAGLRTLFRRDAVERELHDEVQQYLELATDEHIRRGLSRAQAERAARIEFGGIEDAKERVRSAGWDAVVESVIRDLRYAVKTLRASPGYAFVVIATLGAGMGLTTSVVTASHTVLDQQWPVAQPSRLFTVVGRGGPALSPAAAAYVGEHATSFSGVVVVRCLSGLYDECQLTNDGGAVTADLVSGNYFSALGVGMQKGRGFLAEEDRREGPRAVAVMSDAMWRSRFGGDSAIIGRVIRLDDVPFTVIGVTPRRFTGTRMESKDVWLPLSSMLLLRPGRQDVREQLTDPSGDNSEASVSVRLAPDATLERAQAELSGLNQQYRAEHALEKREVRLAPATFFPNPAKVRTARAGFALMITATTLVLLLACANVGNLLLARATARRHEIAVRLALGASRGRVMRQLLTESLVLAAAGGMIGIGIARVLPGMLMKMINGPTSWHFAPDTTIIAVAFVLVSLCCVAVGLAPALHATREDVSAVLKSGVERSSRSASRLSLRGNLLAVQIAISLLLLVNAGMLIRGIQRGRDQDLGFTSRELMAVSFRLPASYVPARAAAFERQLMDETRAMHGPPIAFASAAPLGGSQFARFRLPGEAAQTFHVASTIDISTDLLDLLKLPIVAGRNFEASDGDDAVLVNESMARDLWPGESPLGKSVIDSVERRIVGVVKDANLLRIDRVDHLMLRSLGARGASVMLVRGALPAMTQTLIGIAQRIDPRVKVRAEPISANVERQLGGLRVIAMLGGVLGLIAVVLASVGVFGVFAYVVQQRTREIGVRTALGAPAARVIVLVLSDSMRSIGAGILIGLGAAVGVGQLLRSQLFGATPFDPIVFGMTVIVLAVAGIVATYLPARRATRIDPMTALRNE